MAAIARVAFAPPEDLELRRFQRRSHCGSAVITNHQAFNSAERLVFKSLERRRELRRQVDVKRALVNLR